MQTPSGHCRCKKTQTPSRHEPKTAQTASQKTVSRYLWNPHKQSLGPQSTCPAYANTIWNHIKQLWSHSSHAQPMQTPSGHCRCKKAQTPSRHEPKTAQTASQKTVSRYLWNPHKQSLGPQSTCPAYANTIWNHIKQLWSHRAQSTCPAYANTIWTLQMQKDPNTI